MIKKYLIVLLDGASPSFCHYNKCNESYLMPIPVLKEAIKYAEKNNLFLQFILPSYQLQSEYIDIISKVKNYVLISNTDHNLEIDAFIFDEFCCNDIIVKDKIIAFRVTRDYLFNNFLILSDIIKMKPLKINLIISDIHSFSNSNFETYNNVVNKISEMLIDEQNGIGGNFNILTDILNLSSPNNCNAGIEHITIAPNGKFYQCPAFYTDKKSKDIGCLNSGVEIPNLNLYQIEYAPICRICDSFHCKRCVWLNKTLTGEINTPSYEQCVISHIERNVSKDLLDRLHKLGFYKTRNIKKIDYMDPFELINR